MYTCHNITDPDEREWWSINQAIAILQDELDLVEHAIENTHPDDWASIGYWIAQSNEIQGKMSPLQEGLRNIAARISLNW